MAELDADDEAAQSLSELLAHDGKGTLVFPGISATSCRSSRRAKR